MWWQTYLQPTNVDEALRLLHEHAGHARVVAGGTDVLVELPRGVRPTETLIDVSGLPDLKYVRDDGTQIYLGALATHNDVVASQACARHALPLVQACWEVGAPQIRTRATVAGNVVTASPANDTITPLMALDAALVLDSIAGERVVPLRDFYLGVRRTVMRPDELLREIRLPMLHAHQRGLFLKLGLRRAQAISVINAALVLSFEGASVAGARVVDARITLGCLAPTIVRSPSAEEFLKGRRLDVAVRAEAGRLACRDVAPIDDVRGSAAYRRAALAGLVADGLRRIAAGVEDKGWVTQPVLLDTDVLVQNQEAIVAEAIGPRSTSAAAIRPQSAYLAMRPQSQAPLPFAGVVKTTINGRPYELAGVHTKTLLDALRDDAGLTGTKEGCAEGECGACTVWLNGQAVMACLVPAAQAHNAAITTIEGLAGGEELHPLQAAFIAHGAVQCGYCIPGMLMAGAKLLQERPQPDLEAVRVALSGNICRCTGYRKIADAVLAAVLDPGHPREPGVRSATGGGA